MYYHIVDLSMRLFTLHRLASFSMYGGGSG